MHVMAHLDSTHGAVSLSLSHDLNLNRATLIYIKIWFLISLARYRAALHCTVLCCTALLFRCVLCAVLYLMQQPATLHYTTLYTTIRYTTLHHCALHVLSNASRAEWSGVVREER